MAKTTSTGTNSTTSRTKKPGSKASSSSSKTSMRAANSENETAEKPTSTSKRSNKNPVTQSIATEERERMVQYAAYHIAEKDGFQSGREEDYWLQAEKQIDDLFNARNSDRNGATKISSEGESKNKSERDADIH